MKITTNTNTTHNKTSFKGFYNNKLLLKSLEFASKNGTLFAATTSFTLSTIARPIAIMTTPKTDKENKKVACAKSLASSAIGYLITFVASLPVANAIKNIDETPQKYITNNTIKNLQGQAKSLTSSKKYMMATQFFKLGLGVLIAQPKAIMTCALIPPILNLINKNKSNKNQQERNNKPQHSKHISFKGLQNKITNKISKIIGNLLNKSLLQNVAGKLENTNFAQHSLNITDILLTTTFVNQASKSKKIKNERKKALIHNSIISTGTCIAGGYIINQLLNKPTERFIEKFKEANKNLPNLERYVEGIKIAKPGLILGCIYYIFIPVIATFFADRTSKIK